MADPEIGDPAGQWMVTKVLDRSGDEWQVVHGQFGMPAPLPGEAPAE